MPSFPRGDGWQPWRWVCVFVCRSSAKWPGTEKGPVPRLMSSIIQMESLLSVHRAVVCTLLSQEALPDAPLPRFDASSVYRFLKCMRENKAPWNCQWVSPYCPVCAASFSRSCCIINIPLKAVWGRILLQCILRAGQVEMCFMGRLPTVFADT